METVLEIVMDTDVNDIQVSCANRLWFQVPRAFSECYVTAIVIFE